MRNGEIENRIDDLMGVDNTAKKKSKIRLIFWVSVGCVFLILIGLIFYPVPPTSEIVKKDPKASWILPRPYLNKVLFYQGQACSFFTISYK